MLGILFILNNKYNFKIFRYTISTNALDQYQLFNSSGELIYGFIQENLFVNSGRRRKRHRKLI